MAVGIGRPEAATAEKHETLPPRRGYLAGDATAIEPRPRTFKAVSRTGGSFEALISSGEQVFCGRSASSAIFPLTQYL